MKVILFAVFYYELYGGKIFARNGIIKMCNDFIKKFYSREKIVFYFWRMFNKQSLLSEFPEFFHTF